MGTDGSNAVYLYALNAWLQRETNSFAHYVFNHLCPDCRGMVSDKFVSGGHATAVATLDVGGTTISCQAVTSLRPAHIDFHSPYPSLPPVLKALLT